MTGPVTPGGQPGPYGGTGPEGSTTPGYYGAPQEGTGFPPPGSPAAPPPGYQAASPPGSPAAPPPGYPAAPPPGYQAAPPPGYPAAPPPGYQAAPPPGYSAAPPAQKGKPGKIIGIIAGIVVLLLVVCGVAGYFILNKAKGSAANATVGSCVAGDTVNGTSTQKVKSVTVVDCGAKDAKYKVVGKVDNKTETDLTLDTDNKLCAAYPSAEVALWAGVGSGKGSVLCMETVKK